MSKRNKKLKVYKFNKIKDEFIGEKESPERKCYEFELAKQKKSKFNIKKTK
jgi:hypothetical protein